MIIQKSFWMVLLILIGGLVSCGDKDKEKVEETSEPILQEEQAPLSFDTFAARDRKIIIATDGEYPPFSYLDESGNIRGFDIDLTLALCKVAELDCSVVVQDWSGLIAGLNMNKYDLVSASVSITEERKKVVGFSEPLYSNELVFLGSKSRDFDLSAEGIKNYIVGVQNGTVALDLLQVTDESQMRIYDSTISMYNDFNNGRLDLILFDNFSVQHWLETQALGLYEIKGESIHSDPIGLVFRLSDEELRNIFNEAIVKFKETEDYKILVQKYFNFEIR